MATCLICGAPLPPRRRSYCSDACRAAGQRNWQRAYYARKKPIPRPNVSKTQPRACKICGTPLTGHQRAYCAACVAKYPHWYDRQMFALPPEDREALAQQRSRTTHDQYIRRMQHVAASPEEAAAYKARTRENSRAYYARKKEKK